MSLGLVREEIARFLASSEPEVLAVRGAWGVGKTFTWMQLLTNARENGGIALPTYVYVSLFGVTSLAELKLLLFEQAVGRDLVGTEPTLETLRQNSAELAKSLGKRWIRTVANAIPGLSSVTPSLESLSFLAVRNSIICIDDLERRSLQLEPRDVLGLVSLLKEQRRCKVVLLLNDGEEGMNDFDRYREKVVDIDLLFEPTAKEAAEIAFPEPNQWRDLVGENSVKLDLRNIRTLKRVERLLSLLAPHVSDMRQEVLRQITHSLVLYCWSHYRGANPEIPDLKYVLEIGYALFGLGGREEVPEQQQRWNSILQDYGYRMTDDFDRCIAEVVRNGFVDRARLQASARDLETALENEEGRQAFTSAWNAYHNSFENDGADVLDSLYASFNENARHIAPINLDGTVRLFKELERSDQASEIITTYIDARSDTPEVFDLDASGLGGNVRDPEIRERFLALAERRQERRSLREVLGRIASRDGWGQRDESALAEATEDDFYRVFKSENSDELSDIVNAALRFGRFSNADERQRHIGATATAALRRIAAESDINRLRVRKFGVELDDA